MVKMIAVKLPTSVKAYETLELLGRAANLSDGSPNPEMSTPAGRSRAAARGRKRMVLAHFIGLLVSRGGYHTLADIGIDDFRNMLRIIYNHENIPEHIRDILCKPLPYLDKDDQASQDAFDQAYDLQLECRKAIYKMIRDQCSAMVKRDSSSKDVDSVDRFRASDRYCPPVIDSVPLFAKPLVNVPFIIWTVDPELCDDWTNKGYANMRHKTDPITSVEESVPLIVDRASVPEEGSGVLTSIVLSGVPTIRRLIRAWTAKYCPVMQPQPQTNLADPDYEFGNEEMPRLITGVTEQVAIGIPHTYYFGEESIFPPATTTTVRHTKLKTVPIYTDGDFFRYVRDHNPTTPRLLRFILHRGNRSIPAAPDGENPYPKTPNSPILNPQRRNPAPFYLPEESFEVWKELEHPLLPTKDFTGNPATGNQRRRSRRRPQPRARPTRRTRIRDKNLKKANAAAAANNANA